MPVLQVDKDDGALESTENTKGTYEHCQLVRVVRTGIREAYDQNFIRGTLEDTYWQCLRYYW